MIARPSLAASNKCGRTSGLGRVSPRNPAVLDAGIQAHLGQHLRDCYGEPCAGQLPDRLARLLARVTQVLRARPAPIDPGFVDGVVASLTALRGFAVALTRNTDQAEDLVQETVLRALSKHEQFEAGTNLQAWLFTILRNHFFSAHRRAMREEEDVEGAYAAAMMCRADQEDKAMMRAVAAALSKLPPAQRQAIVLVGAEGLSYEEAAQALGCAIGTVKSRVNRARSGLADLIGWPLPDGARRGAL